jgi:hypothetical protein
MLLRVMALLVGAGLVTPPAKGDSGATPPPRVVKGEGFEVHIAQPERLRWRLVTVGWQPLPDTKFDPALYAEPSGLAGFLQAGPLTQFALVAREQLRDALAPRADALAKAGFALPPVSPAGWKPAPTLDWAPLLAGKIDSWAAVESLAASALTVPSSDPKPTTVPADGYAAHLRQLAYASLGAPAPGAASLAGEPQGIVGDFPPTTTLVNPTAAAEPLGGFALAHALGVRRLRAALESVAKASLADKMTAPRPDHPRALRAATVGEALQELEETLLGAAESAGLPDGLSWSQLPWDDAARARARLRIPNYLTRWRRVTPDGAKGKVEPGSGDDYRVARATGTLVGWTMRPVEIFFAERPKHEVVDQTKPGSMRNLAFGLYTVYTAVPVYAEAGAPLEPKALRGKLAGRATIDDALSAVRAQAPR